MNEPATRLPAWCERRRETRDGRYVIACYFTREGHPVPRAHAERIRLTEYDIEGNELRIEEGIVRSGLVDRPVAPPVSPLRIAR